MDQRSTWLTVWLLQVSTPSRALVHPFDYTPTRLNPSLYLNQLDWWRGLRRPAQCTFYSTAPPPPTEGGGSALQRAYNHELIRSVTHKWWIYLIKLSPILPELIAPMRIPVIVRSWFSDLDSKSEMGNSQKGFAQRESIILVNKRRCNRESHRIDTLAPDREVADATRHNQHLIEIASVR